MLKFQEILKAVSYFVSLFTLFFAQVMEFVDLLKNPDKYKELGAKPPKGAILLGKTGIYIMQNTMVSWGKK